MNLDFLLLYYYYDWVIEQHINKMMLGYKYTKLDRTIMTPSLIWVYQTHASRSNVCDMVIDFQKSSSIGGQLKYLQVGYPSSVRQSPIEGVSKDLDVAASSFKLKNQTLIIANQMFIYDTPSWTEMHRESAPSGYAQLVKIRQLISTFM